MINSGNLNDENVSITGTGYTLALSTNVDGYQVASDGRSIIYSTGSDSGSSTGSDSGSTLDGSSGSIIYGSINSIDDYLAPAAADSVVETGSVEGSTVAISWENLGLAIETNEIHGSEVDINQPNSVMINENGGMTATNSTDSDAVISVDANTNSATLVMNESNRSYNLTFHGGAIVANWNARLSSGNDKLHIGNIKGGHFDGGAGKDYFHVTKNLQGNISLTGGASDQDSDSGNNFYAESNSVSSSSDQSKITITDVNFNATDILLIDAEIENLTSDFFGDSKFYNYATVSDASTDQIYLDGQNIHVIFGNSEGNDTIYGWNSTDYLEFDSMPSSMSISNGNLYLENENGTMVIDGSFTNSTNIRYNDGILRVGNSNVDVIYDRSVTYYAGSNLILNYFN